MQRVNRIDVRVLRIIHNELEIVTSYGTNVLIGDPIPYTSQKVHRPEFFPERDRSTCACLTARSFARSLASSNNGHPIAPSAHRPRFPPHTRCAHGFSGTTPVILQIAGVSSVSVPQIDAPRFRANRATLYATEAPL